MIMEKILSVAARVGGRGWVRGGEYVQQYDRPQPSDLSVIILLNLKPTDSETPLLQAML